MKLLILLLIFSLSLRADILFSNPSAGGNGQYGDCGSSSNFDNFWTAGSDGFAICGYVNLTGTEPTNKQPRIWSSRDGTGGIALSIDLQIGSPDAVPKFAMDWNPTDMFIYAGTLGTGYWNTSTGWRTFCMTWPHNGTGSGGTGSPLWSINGATVQDGDISAGGSTIQSDAGKPRWIGANPGPHNFWTGYFAWLILYSRELTQSEENYITGEKNIRKALAWAKSAVFAAYDFSAGRGGTSASGAPLNDLSGNNNHCIVTGTWADINQNR